MRGPVAPRCGRALRVPDGPRIPAGESRAVADVRGWDFGYANHPMRSTVPPWFSRSDGYVRNTGAQATFKQSTRETGEASHDDD